MNDDYLILDIETTINNRGEGAIGSFAASPWRQDNWIVAVGSKRKDKEVQIKYFETSMGHQAGYIIPDSLTVVGHNIKFDLHYLRRYYASWRDWLNNQHVTIWDTQLAEYLLSGQFKLFPSLDYCSAKYGGTQKDDAISDYWKSGVNTCDIPKEQLLEYLHNDVLNTERVYLAQRARAKELGMLALIETNMRALLAIIDMEYNGMAFDVVHAQSEVARNKTSLEKLTAHIFRILQSRLPRLPWYALNPNSRDQLSIALFGGTYKYEEYRPVRDETGNLVHYKSGTRKGQAKTRKTVQEHTVPGRNQVSAATSKAGIYCTDDETLETMSDPLAKLAREHRALTKQIATYFEGYSALVWPDGRIHPELHMTSTATGRLSCSQPNLQNATSSNKPLRECFTSRWGANGRLVEVDLAQIEIVVQAHVTGDKQMRQDVLDGVDFHCKRLAFSRGETYEHVYRRSAEQDSEYIAERKAIKAFSFQRAYGAGASKIAEALKLPLQQIKEFIKTEDALYPGVRKQTELWLEEIKRNRKPSVYRTTSGKPAGISWFGSQTGKRYVLLEEDAPEFLKRDGIVTSFKPTKIQNYEIQGMASEIMKVILAELRINLLSFRDQAVLINTVHDSVMLDVREEVIDEIVRLCIEVCESAPKLIRQAYGFNFTLPVRAEAKVGKSWANMLKETINE